MYQKSPVSQRKIRSKSKSNSNNHSPTAFQKIRCLAPTSIPSRRTAVVGHNRMPIGSCIFYKTNLCKVSPKIFFSPLFGIIDSVDFEAFEFPFHPRVNVRCSLCFLNQFDAVFARIFSVIKFHRLRIWVSPVPMIHQWFINQTTCLPFALFLVLSSPGTTVPRADCPKARFHSGMLGYFGRLAEDIVALRDGLHRFCSQFAAIPPPNFFFSRRRNPISINIVLFWKD